MAPPCSSLHSLHGCCGVRLPQQFWATLPEPLEAARVTFYHQSKQNRIPNLIKTTDNLRIRLFGVKVLICVFLFFLEWPTPLHLYPTPRFTFSAPLVLIYSAEGKHRAIFVSCRGWTCFRWTPGFCVWTHLLTPAPPAPRHQSTREPRPSSVRTNGFLPLLELKPAVSIILIV